MPLHRRRRPWRSNGHSRSSRISAASYDVDEYLWTEEDDDDDYSLSTDNLESSHSVSFGQVRVPRGISQAQDHPMEATDLLPLCSAHQLQYGMVIMSRRDRRAKQLQMNSPWTQLWRGVVLCPQR